MNALQRAAARLRAAVAPAAAAPVKRAPTLADLIGPAAPRALTAADFAAGAQIAGAASEIARVTLPRGDVHSVLVGVPLRAYIFGRFVASVATGVGETTAALDLGAAGLTMARSTRDAPALPTSSHPDVRAYSSTDGTTWTARNVSAVDFAAGTVTVAGLTAETAYTLRVYFLPASGAFRVRAIQPSGLDSRSVELYNDSFRALHETDQADGETAPRIKRAGVAAMPLGPKWGVTLEATTAATIPWGDELAPHEVRIPGNRAPVIVNDEASLNRALGAALRSA